MECKACGKRTESKSCKALTGAVYRNLYDLLLDGPARLTAAAVHQFLAADPSVVCKVCCSVLNKYGGIKENLKSIINRVTTALPSATTSSVIILLFLLHSLKYYPHTFLLQIISPHVGEKRKIEEREVGTL